MDRNTGRTIFCKNCAFWDMARNDDDDLKIIGYGKCRRHAPKPTATEPGCDAFWYDTRTTDWCGEFVNQKDVQVNL